MGGSARSQSLPLSMNTNVSGVWIQEHTRVLHDGVVRKEVTQVVCDKPQTFRLTHTINERDPWDGETTERVSEGAGKWSYILSSDTLILHGVYLSSEYTDFKHSADEDVFSVTSTNQGTPLIMSLTSFQEDWRRKT